MIVFDYDKDYEQYITAHNYISAHNILDFVSNQALFLSLENLFSGKSEWALQFANQVLGELNRRTLENEESELRMKSEEIFLKLVEDHEEKNKK